MRTIGLLAVAVLIFATCSNAQGVQGVHPDGAPLEVGLGATFVNFHEVPNVTVSNFGFTASALYRYNQIGLEGEVTDAVSSQSGASSQFVFAGGGARYYMWDFGDIHPWVEGEAGLAHLSPKSSFGSTSALGYKLGVGIDLNPLRSRVEYRVSASFLGSSFFGTYQVSPEFSVGLVIPIGSR